MAHKKDWKKREGKSMEKKGWNFNLAIQIERFADFSCLFPGNEVIVDQINSRWLDWPQAFVTCHREAGAGSPDKVFIYFFPFFLALVFYFFIFF